MCIYGQTHILSCRSTLHFAGNNVHSVETQCISECAIDLSPERSLLSPSAAGDAAVARPTADKLPLRAVSDRMNVDASVVESPSMPPLRRLSKGRDGAGVPDVVQFPLSINENMTGETAEAKWSTAYDDETRSNSDDEVCDVFSRARRVQTAAAMSGWLSCDLVDGRCCVRLLLTAGCHGTARYNRMTGVARRWLHDNRTATVMNAVELPRPYLDFTKMQVLSQPVFIYVCRTQTEKCKNMVS